MKVVLLAGGLGTRMREESSQVPKPMVEVGGKPLLWHIMKHYSHFGLNEFIICLGYKGKAIREYFLQYPYWTYDTQVKNGQLTLLEKNPEQEWSVTLVDTGITTQTGGRIKAIQKYIGNNPFMATYGDGLSNVDINLLMKSHIANQKTFGSLATLTTVPNKSKFGEIDWLSADGSSYGHGQATSFEEKSKTNWINGGFFVFEPEIFEYIENPCDPLETGLLAWLTEQGQLGVYRHDGYWGCVDSPKELTTMNVLWDSGNPPWRVYE